MSREPLPTWCIALAVVHDDAGRFLLIQETDGRWFFPAGRMQRGETWSDTMQRVALEEAGIPLILQGLYKVEHRPVQDGARMRVFFVAQPLTDAPLKSTPDAHSRGAAWFTLPELKDVEVRNLEVLRVLIDLVKGAPIHPLDVLRVEGEVLATA